MKNILFLFMVFGFVSCDNDESIEEVSKLVGSWQIIANSFSVGGPQQIMVIEEGGIYHFDLSGTFTFDDTIDPSFNFSGKYRIDAEVLELEYKRNGEDIVRKLKSQFEDNTVVLSPADPILCIEGCSFTLQRVN